MPQNSQVRLVDHLLARLLGFAYDGDEQNFTDEQREAVQISQNHIYEHGVLRVNYTSYDVRRAQDSINPQTHSDVMVLSHDDDTGPNGILHPYWYARVLGIFHMMVHYTRLNTQSTDEQRMDFLWVRWFGVDPDVRTGWRARRLPAIGFVPDSDPDAYGFVDPQEVLRGAHLLPAFNHDQATNVLDSETNVRRANEVDDWNLYYPNM